ncbi:NADH-quinone oxidoreductase subunit NuoG [Iamia sp. SCSIO 61187]|uniref:NADH-quinone oxidoreductase subunit NuoG n=1 Tax=Iamia sp. SCSIO 61187 TaxID=2722752 RepID=UPI001C62C4C6|nr:NADH-quinone oxidoreductase subunit NuoG [Iamia sp. SCSIO 61187]QYG94811.1 NADH-quinone oxidoreductase subunit NuoG [Iamia sp. SCSIO 61187]
MTDTRTETVTVTVDGHEVAADKGELVIDAAERAGVYIPRFCYHPRMKPVGMCRQCLVEIDTGRGPALQPSCMIECSDGMTVETGTPVTIKAQTGVLEFLLINHPLDCPVCDKGGECPLQDQAMSHGPGESRMVEEKRHFEKPIPVSDLVLLDRERCILCDRCTRFADEVAGEPLIHFIDRGNQTQVNTFPDHPFASYYSGNTVQICPVGALTSSSYRFKARPWDLVQVESTCQGCAMGCRTSVDTSRNRVLRQNGVDVDPVNWGWLCDKGRFGFEAIESDERLGAPLVRAGDDLVETTWSDAVRFAADAIKDAKRAGGAGAVAVLGGARLTNEDAYAWAKLAKGVIGTDHVDAQMGDGLPAEVVLGLPRATIDGLCAPGGTILWIGADPREELAVLYLRLRHAVLEDGVRLVAVTPTATALDGLATAAFHPAPGDLPALVAALLDGGEAPDGTDATALAAARELLDGEITVALGRGSVAESAGYTVDAAAVLARTRPEAKVLPLLRRANVNGALDMGLAPGLLPGRTTLESGADRLGVVWPRVPKAPGLDATGILTAAAEGKVDVLVLLGADPLADFPDRELAAAALAGARTIIAVDLFLTESSSRADVVLAAAGPNEVTGTHTNVEGRISVLGQAVTPPGTARPAWMLAAEVAMRLGADLGLESVADIWAEIESVAPSHAGITAEVLAATGDGVVAPMEAAPLQTTVVDDEGVALGGTDLGPEGGAAQPEVDQDDAPEPSGEGAAHGDTGSTGPEGAEADDAELTESDHEGGGDAATVDVVEGPDDEQDEGTSSPSVRFVAPEPTPVPPVDSYALRLVVSRTLYDDGTLTQAAPAIAGLAGDAPLRVHPTVLERLGVEAGSRVRATSPRAAVSLTVVADPGVPRGVAAVALRRSGGAGDLVDVGQPVTEVRVETTS